MFFLEAYSFLDSKPFLMFAHTTGYAAFNTKIEFSGVHKYFLEDFTSLYTFISEKSFLKVKI